MLHNEKAIDNNQQVITLGYPPLGMVISVQRKV